jgi:hypothetical protein
MTTPHDIDDFWIWFTSKAAEFGLRFENLELIDELDRKVRALGHFAWELGPGYFDSSNSALGLSPGGDADTLQRTRAIVGVAPTIPTWEFFPAKPPKRWFRKFTLDVPGGDAVEVDARGWRYVLTQYPERSFDIAICAPDLFAISSDLRETAAEIVLDAELGEAARIDFLVQIETVEAFDCEFQAKSSSIDVLARHLAVLTDGESNFKADGALDSQLHEE